MTIEKILNLCSKMSIDVDDTKILAITIHKARGEITSQFCTYIVDFKRNKVLSHYPHDVGGAYKEKIVGPFYCVYKSDLEYCVIDEDEESAFKDTGYIFCCDALTPYRECITQRDSLFSDFKALRGNHPKYAFEVKRQINNGRMLSTKFFSIEHDAVAEVSDKGLRKCHSFKNYICQTHNLFFGVDLYEKTGLVEMSSKHHMRLNTFTKQNERLLDEFISLL